MRDIETIVTRIRADLPVTNEEFGAALDWAHDMNAARENPPLTIRRLMILILIGAVFGILMLIYPMKG